MNESQRILVIFFLLTASVTAAVLAYRALKLRHKVMWASSFVIMSVGGIIWLLSNTARLLSTIPAVWILSTCTGALGIAMATFGLMMFSIQFSTGVRKIPQAILLTFLPLILVLLTLTWTNDLHHWVWVSWPSPGRDLQPGPLLTAFNIVIYSQVAVALTVLVRSFFSRDGIYRAQTGLLIIGVMIPVIAGLTEDVLRLDIFFGVEEAALAIVVTIAIFALVTLRYGSFNVIPVAYKLMVDNMQDGLIVLDLDNQVVSNNPAAAKFLGGSQSTWAGMAFDLVLAGWSPEAQAAWTAGKRDFEVVLTGEVDQSYRLTARDLIEGASESAGKLVMIYDITTQKQQETRLQDMAINDPLTGCFNRGHFMECAKKQYRQARRYHRPLSVAMIDLDHFKRVNDSFGHAVGDRVLKQVVAACLAAIRRSDIFARFGGEEFIVMMPETEGPAAILVAERLREAISHQFLQGVSVTASIGVARLDPEEEIDLEQLIDRADQAQYRSKELGRDRVTIWKK